jgi:Tol biopolymer transport system component
MVSLSMALFAGSDPARAQSTERASVDSGGVEGNAYSEVPSLSADGRFVAFRSDASNLVAGDTNGQRDLFVRDRQNGATERVSVDSSGVQGNGDSHFSALSADGRFVAFDSSSGNLVANDTNGFKDIFVRDRLLGTTELVSVDSAGVQGNANVFSPWISADGRYVAFFGAASNLVAGDTNGVWDVFVHDRLSGITERVSVDSAGVQGNGTSAHASISGDGRFVAFESSASNLVAGDTNAAMDIFVRDRLNGTTERVSLGAGAAQGSGQSASPALSPDGRYVAFHSYAANLVAGDTNAVADIFVRDRQLGTTERASTDSAGVQGNGISFQPALSADGRLVVFESVATNLVAGDTNGVTDVFVHDRLSGTTERVSIDSAGAEGNGNSTYAALSGDGRCVSFQSQASNLVAGDTNGFGDVFVRDRGVPAPLAYCTPGLAGVIGCPCANPPSGADRGCDNSAGTGGAWMTGNGTPSLAADTLVFTTGAERASATSIVLQGTSSSAAGVVFGQGVRCVAGTLKRLYTRAASGGSISVPSGSDPSVSARSAALGNPIVAGQHRYYMVYYRDPIVLGGCPATSTFNGTDALDVLWAQ